MKTKLAKKTKIIIVVISVLLIVGILVLLFINNKPKTKEESDNNECGTYTVKYSNEQISGYDYIIQEMNKAEYWDEDYLYEYLPKEDADELAKTNPNGTGWYLSDAKNASFTRGVKNKVTYNFSNFTASYIDETGDSVTVYDFLNNELRVYMLYNMDNVINSRSLINDPNDPISDILYQCGSFNEFDLNYIEKIYKNSMLNYAYLFELAGCPILMQPEGTLESYKNKMINPIEDYQKINMEYGDYYEARKAIVDYNGNPYADSSKIDGPWELEDYVYDLRDNKSIQWIDDYTKVADIAKDLPEYIYEPDGYDVSQASLVFVNKDYYDTQETYGNFNGMYRNQTSNLYAYYVRPILQKVYGKDVTYFYDEGDHNIPLLQPNNYDAGGYDNAMQVWFPILPESADTQVSVYRSPQSELSGYIYFIHDIDNFFFEGCEEEIFNQIESLCIASNTENPFSDIYKFNFMITIDDHMQERLGLR